MKQCIANTFFVGNQHCGILILLSHLLTPEVFQFERTLKEKYKYYIKYIILLLNRIIKKPKKLVLLSKKSTNLKRST